MPIVLFFRSAADLISGRETTDATTLWPPFNIYAEQLGLRVLAYVGDYLEFPQSGFTVRRFNCVGESRAHR